MPGFEIETLQGKSRAIYQYPNLMAKIAAGMW
jgi:hypothetical protein